MAYEKPLERVLFNQARDCNPFFHVYESLWMLSGRNDVAPLAYYNSKMTEFSDDGKIFNGAYGYRWRHAFICDYEDVDQLEWIIKHLKGSPESRRAVLQMWNVSNDLMDIGLKLMPEYQDKPGSKDVCCNLSALFSIEPGVCNWCGGRGKEPVFNDDVSQAGYSPTVECMKCNGKPHDQSRYLNMTVFNRSNDMIWGMLGANYVHFSYLQEYVAAHLGA